MLLLLLLLWWLCLLLTLPYSPHGLLLLPPVCTGKVAYRVLQEALVGLLALHWAPQECCDPGVLRALLQLLRICCNKRSKAAQGSRAQIAHTAIAQVRSRHDAALLQRRHGTWRAQADRAQV